MTRGGLDAEEQIQRTSDHRDPEAVEAGRTVRDVCREHEISDQVLLTSRYYPPAV